VQAALSNEALMLVLVGSGGHISYSHGMKNSNWSVLYAEQYMREMQELKQLKTDGLLK